MDSEWDEGDLALCIKQSAWRDRATGDTVDYGPGAGGVLTVSRVAASDIPGMGVVSTLSFREWGNDQFAAYHFVKFQIGNRGNPQRTGVKIAAGIDALE